MMNKHLKDYLRSFRFNKTYWKTFLIDFIIINIILALFFCFNAYNQNKSLALTKGRTTEQLKQILVNNPDQLAIYLTQLKSFLLMFFAGLILLVILSLALYSLSNALIWNYLTKKKTTWKNIGRWSILNLAIIIPLLLYGISYLVLNLFLGYLVYSLLTLSPQFYSAHLTALELFRQLLFGSFSLFFAVLALTFIFLIYYSFTQKYKVWSSIGEAFGTIKNQWPKIWRLLFFALLTGIILTIVAYPLKSIISNQPLAITMFQIIISILFIAWLRLYLLRTVHGEHQDEH